MKRELDVWGGLLSAGRHCNRSYKERHAVEKAGDSEVDFKVSWGLFLGFTNVKQIHTVDFKLVAPRPNPTWHFEGHKLAL